MKYYFYTFKNSTGRRVSVREFITRQTCKICDYTVDYMCRTKTIKFHHAFAMCSIRTDLLKQENEKINLEMQECHNFRHVFRGTIDFARVTLHIQE